MNIQGLHRVLNRRQALWLMAGAIGTLSLSACVKSQEKPTAKTLSASFGTVTWIGCAPLYIAQEKGFFQEQGLDLDIKVFGSNADANAAFIAGRLDGWAPVTSEAVLIATKGKDYRVVLVEDNSVGGDGILARNSISSIKDFKGKKIALEKGGVSHFFLLQVLKEAGLSERDVTLVNVTPDAAAAAYQAGNIEIAVTYSPFLQNANAARKDGRIIYDSSKMPSAISDLYIFDTKFVESNPKLSEAFVRGIFKALDFLNKNPQQGLAIAAQKLNLKPEELSAQLKGVRLADLPNNIEMLAKPESDLYLLKSMTAIAQFLKDQKQIDHIPDLSKLLEPKFVLAVEANP